MVLPVGPLVVTDELSIGELLVSSLVVPPVSGGVGLDSALQPNITIPVTTNFVAALLIGLSVPQLAFPRKG